MACMTATEAFPGVSRFQPGELVLEIKMPGDHLDMLAIDRAVLRRNARHVQRSEESKTPWDGEEALWIVAPHVPAILSERRTLDRVAAGVYRVNPSPFGFLWIAANELPLADELIPFLIARSGRPLDAFVGWVKNRRPIEWLLRVLAYLPTSTATDPQARRPEVAISDPVSGGMRTRSTVAPAQRLRQAHRVRHPWGLAVESSVATDPVRPAFGPSRSSRKNAARSLRPDSPALR